jgi:hypothetical protein
LYDEQGITSKLFFAADLFLTEAFATFHKHLGQSPKFWDTCADSIQESILAFWEVDAMQKRQQVSFKEMRSGHARIASIFKIASAAVCYLAGRRHDYSIVETALDELAIAGQILDDFQDMDEDIKQGRLNYAARFILGSSAKTGAKSGDASSLVAERILYSDRVARLFEEIAEHVESSYSTVARLKIPEAAKYYSNYKQSIKKTADALDRERMRHIFRTGDRN